MRAAAGLLLTMVSASTCSASSSSSTLKVKDRVWLESSQPARRDRGTRRVCSWRKRGAAGVCPRVTGRTRTGRPRTRPRCPWLAWGGSHAPSKTHAPTPATAGEGPWRGLSGPCTHARGVQSCALQLRCPPYFHSPLVPKKKLSIVTGAGTRRPLTPPARTRLSGLRNAAAAAAAMLRSRP